MDLELVTIGTELLLGFTVDTNGAEIARVLAAAGVHVVRRTAVADRSADIRDAVHAALSRTGTVLTTGGLGPTRDDITKRAVADMFGLPLEFDETVWADVLARFARLRRIPVASNRSQAEVPAGATVLPNRWGTAPGLWLEAPYAETPSGAGLVILLPGVPFEMRMLLQHEVVPRLAGRSDGAVIRSLSVRTTGVPESTLAERMGDIEREIAPLTLAYLPGLEGVDLRLSAWELGPDEAERRLRAAADLIRCRADEFIYGEGDTDLAALVLDRARAKGLRLGAAESCTGGLVGGRLTEVPGSSDVFMGAVVCYHNDLKTSLLGVPSTVIAAEGAVSEAVARAMAAGARARLAVDAAVAVTGIAGPGGGTEAKPVGTIWLAVALG
ncbi:MAG TPA: CinA family nicotinamide mononucleotide deamidase-related protein [Candidatus Dormibacteraeota bacterium]|nr:CinA family nicotinamide mononucleotide deamidase-related protein [Candidatus Dormibacteraeota bacterium]